MSRGGDGKKDEPSIETQKEIEIYVLKQKLNIAKERFESIIERIKELDRFAGPIKIEEQKKQEDIDLIGLEAILCLHDLVCEFNRRK